VRAKPLRETAEIPSELLYAYQLNKELLETLELTFVSIMDYCRQKGIPIQDRKLASLLAKVNNLLVEFGSTPPFLQHRKRTPQDETEPKKASLDIEP
jgi:hypothetical protein